jgi:O-antigen/teichoic acid export membrane protein
MMLGIDSLGIYSIAVNLAELAFLVPTSVSNVLTGRLYNINNQVENKKNVTYKTVKYTFYISMVVVFIGMIMTPLIPIVYGKGFSDAANITLVLFIGIIFASIGKVAYTYFFTEGRPIIHLKVTAITFLTNISFNFILIHFRYDRCCIASTISILFWIFVPSNICEKRRLH